MNRGDRQRLLYICLFNLLLQKFQESGSKSDNSSYI